MKKLLSVLCMIAALSGCGQDDSFDYTQPSVRLSNALASDYNQKFSELELRYINVRCEVTSFGKPQTLKSNLIIVYKFGSDEPRQMVKPIDVCENGVLFSVRQNYDTKKYFVKAKRPYSYDLISPIVNDVLNSYTFTKF